MNTFTKIKKQFALRTSYNELLHAHYRLLGSSSSSSSSSHHHSTLESTFCQVLTDCDLAQRAIESPQRGEAISHPTLLCCLVPRKHCATTSTTNTNRCTGRGYIRDFLYGFHWYSSPFRVQGSITPDSGGIGSLPDV